jgi:hypothetical protein
MKATIDAIVPRDDFSTPGQVVHLVDVRYSTDKGLHGTVTLPKTGLTQAVIQAAVLADAATLHNAIGTTFSI